MLNSRQINYFGKLRRRREFLKSANLSQSLYSFWELWFSKCSRQNSFLPFLDNRNKSEYPTWLFIINDEENIKMGLTIMSSDMSERRFPFVVYFIVNSIHIKNKDYLKQDITYLAQRYDKFKRIVAIGSPDTEDLEIFDSDKDINELSSDLLLKIDSITHQVVEEGEPFLTSSYWLNLSSSSYLQHDGAFTCALYNKVYG